MGGFDQVAWLPLCTGLTVLGLILSFTVGRRRGASAVIRGIAWSLLPIAAYLTGVLPLVWDTATALAGWVGRLVFSPKVWVGVALAGLAVLLFMISGGMRGRAAARGRATRPAVEGAGSRQVPAGTRPALQAGQASRQPATAGAGATAAARRPAANDQAKQQAKKPEDPLGDDDFSEVEEILRRRGIT
jgi:hypothetical protein